MNFPPTAEQTLILEAARTLSDNLLINARAGAAKTTTIEMIAEDLAPLPILCLSFNKKIALELQARLPANTTSATLNSVGHKAWSQFVGRFLKVDAKKCGTILTGLIEQNTMPGDERKELKDKWSEMMDSIRLAKSSGYLPAPHHASAKPLIADSSFYDLCEVEHSTLERHLIDETLRQSFKLALEGEIDFDDQLYCTALMPVSFPTSPLTMIDEAQDLSAINHAMLRKIVRNRRLIAVGDPCQAIYGFRGASEKSMKDMQSEFKMQELYLTICFRSAQSIVENARWRAPDMQWRPGAPAGLVRVLPSWGPEALQDGDAIICRNNAPLFSMAIALIRARLLPELSSGDIIKGLLTVLKKLGPAKLPQADALTELQRWHLEQLDRVKNKTRLQDQTSCLQCIIEETTTLGEAHTFLQDLASRTGRIKLMTGHKSKGLEFNRVFFLDQHIIKKEGQDLNLRYVIQTRAKEELYMVRSEDWIGADSTRYGHLTYPRHIVTLIASAQETA